MGKWNKRMSCTTACCYDFSLYTRKYIGCASICMVLELNSIFLHIRQLMVIEEVDRGSRAFRAIAVLNMATFIAFRIGTTLI